MPHEQGYRQPQASSSQQPRDEPKTHANMWYYVQDVPDLYFQLVYYQADGGHPLGYHVALDYREYQGQPQGTAQTLIPGQASPTPQPITPKEEWTSRIADVIQHHFGLKPKGQTYMYQHPYIEEFDQVPLPNRYRLPDFSKFSGQDNISTIEHISRFLAQCGEAATEDALMVQLFSLSLSGSAFTWFVSLPPANSIRSLADLEKQFHKYFFIDLHEMRLAGLSDKGMMNRFQSTFRDSAT
jgi:hypothetical protein